MNRASLLVLFLLPACAKAGMGASVRTDVTARMESARGTFADCYHAALERDRKLRGQIVVTFVAAPSTGKFERVDIVRDDLRDQALVKCVVDAVAGLSLEAPQKTAVSVSAYPLDFAPTK